MENADIKVRDPVEVQPSGAKQYTHGGPIYYYVVAIKFEAPPADANTPAAQHLQRLIANNNGSTQIQVQRRYTDFEVFHQLLSRVFWYCVLPPIPSKDKMKTIMSGIRTSTTPSKREGSVPASGAAEAHTQNTIVEYRRWALQQYLKRFVAMEPIRQHELLYLFVDDSKWAALVNNFSSGAGNPQYSGYTVPFYLTAKAHSAISSGGASDASAAGAGAGGAAGGYSLEYFTNMASEAVEAGKAALQARAAAFSADWDVDTSRFTNAELAAKVETSKFLIETLQKLKKKMEALFDSRIHLNQKLYDFSTAFEELCASTTPASGDAADATTGDAILTRSTEEDVQLDKVLRACIDACRESATAFNNAPGSDNRPSKAPPLNFAKTASRIVFMIKFLVLSVQEAIRAMANKDMAERYVALVDKEIAVQESRVAALGGAGVMSNTNAASVNQVAKARVHIETLKQRRDMVETELNQKMVESTFAQNLSYYDANKRSDLLYLLNIIGTFETRYYDTYEEIWQPLKPLVADLQQEAARA